MSDTQEGRDGAMPQLYDGLTDQMRPATQADIDLLRTRATDLGMFWVDLRRLVAQTRAKMPPPSLHVTGPHDADGKPDRAGAWLHLHLDGDAIRLTHDAAQELIAKLRYALERRSDVA